MPPIRPVEPGRERELSHWIGRPTGGQPSVLGGARRSVVIRRAALAEQQLGGLVT